MVHWKIWFEMMFFILKSRSKIWKLNSTKMKIIKFHCLIKKTINSIKFKSLWYHFQITLQTVVIMIVNKSWTFHLRKEARFVLIKFDVIFIFFVSKISLHFYLLRCFSFKKSLFLSFLECFDDLWRGKDGQVLDNTGFWSMFVIVVFGRTNSHNAEARIIPFRVSSFGRRNHWCPSFWFPQQIQFPNYEIIGPCVGVNIDVNFNSNIG